MRFFGNREMPELCQGGICPYFWCSRNACLLAGQRAPMIGKSIRQMVTLALLLFVAGPAPRTAGSQVAGQGALDETVAPGNNYDKAEFRLWLPENAAPLQRIPVLVPGSNGDGRPMAVDGFSTEIRHSLPHHGPAQARFLRHLFPMGRRDRHDGFTREAIRKPWI
jgi:hypothetical protein